MKCEKCGHFNPYWRTNWRDTEREFAKLEDVKWWSLANMPEDTRLKMDLGEIVEWNGFAWKQSKKFIRRIPLEIYKARGGTRNDDTRTPQSRDHPGILQREAYRRFSGFGCGARRFFNRRGAPTSRTIRG